MQLIINTTSDLILHTSKIRDWELSYYQTTPGEINCHLRTIALDGKQVFIESFDQSVTQYGCVPAGSIGFAMVLYETPLLTSTLQGNEFLPGNLYMVGSGKEFLNHLAKGTVSISFTVPIGYIESISEECGFLDAEAFRMDWSFAAVKSSAVSELAQVASLLCQLNQYEHRDEYDARTLINSASNLLIKVFSEKSNVVRGGFFSEVRSDIVRKCREIAISRCEGVNIRELCCDLKISRRTLQYAFNHVTGQSPLYHLRNLRLGEARKAIYFKQHSPIGDLACACGFNHLGRFTAKYNELFSELPSITRRRYLSCLD